MDAKLLKHPFSLTFILLSSLALFVTSIDIENGGYLDEDFTMTIWNSPYLIRNSLFVQKNAVLRIDAGVEVRFSPKVMLAVNGTLIAQGSEVARIKLTKDPGFGTSPPSWPEDIRLVDEWSVTFGRLQLNHQGQWRGICANSVNWTQTDVDVACRQLGFKNGSFSFVSWSQNDTDFMRFYQPDCVGNETNLMNCPGSSKIEIGHKICVQQQTVHLHCDGISPGNPSRDNWWGLELYNSTYTLSKEGFVTINESASILQHVDIEFAGLDNLGQPVPALRASPRPPHLVDVTIQHCALDGTNFTDVKASSIIHNSHIENNRGHGIVIQTHLGRVSITDSVISGNQGNGIKTKFLNGKFPIFDEMKTFCRQNDFPGGEAFPQIISGIPMLSPPCSKVFRTQPGYVITLTFVEMDIEPDAWGQIELYDNQHPFASDKIQTINIQNGTMPTGITTTREFLYMKFEWTIPVVIGQNCPTLFDCVKFTIVLDSAPKTVPEFSMNNTQVINNTQHGVYLENARNYFYINASTLSGNQYGAGLRVFGGAGDVHVNSSKLEYNRDNGVNITYDGGLRIFNMSSFSHNLGNGVNVTLNQTQVDNQTYYARQQITEVFRCEFIGNDGYGVRVGNYCRVNETRESQPGKILKNKVAVNDSIFEYNRKDGVNLESCFRIIPEATVSNLTVAYNRFKANYGHGIRITPLINAEGRISNNTFEMHTRHALLIDNSDDFLKSQFYAQLPVDYEIHGNTFYMNQGFYVAHIRLTQGSSRQSCSFMYNIISDNAIQGAANDNLNERTRAYAVVIISSSNVDFSRNQITNPDSRYELATHLLDKQATVDCTRQWWGTTDYDVIIQKIFDQFARYNLAKMDYHPVLLNSDLYNSPVADQQIAKEIDFSRGDYLGGRLAVPFTTQAGKTYYVDRDINIMPLGRLTLSPGTSLQFGNALGLLVQGFMEARGTEGQTVQMLLKNQTTFVNHTLIRLVDGPNELEGRLEVRPSDSDEWGTICNQQWDRIDASVACKMLGLVIHPDDWQVFSNLPGEAEQPIWRSSVQCTDLDMNVMECEADGPYDHSCLHTDDVYLRCKPPTWAGIHFLTTARPSAFVHGVVSQAGLMDPSAILYSSAIRIDYNLHTLEHLLIENNMADGLVVMKNDVYANVRITNSIVRNNLGNGVSSRTSFFEVHKCNLYNNRKAGFEYNPHYTAYEAQQMRAGIHTENVLNQPLKQIHIENEGREFVVTEQDCCRQAETFQMEISVNNQYRVVMDIIDYNPDTEVENITVFDSAVNGIMPQTIRWQVEDDLVDFPVVSTASHLTVRWIVRGISTGRFTFVVRSKNHQWRWPFGILKVTNTTTESNYQGIVTRHYNQPSNEFQDLFFRYRWETLHMYGVHFYNNLREALHVPSITKYHELYMPTHEELQIPEKLAEINYELESCLFEENGEGVLGEHNHVEFSNNVWIWEVSNNVFKKNKGGGFMIELPKVNLMYTELYNHSVDINDTMFIDNEEFAFRIDGFYCNSTIARNQWVNNRCKLGCITIAGTEKDFEMHDNKMYDNVGKYILELNMQSHTPYTQWVEARMEYNDFKRNRRMNDGLPPSITSSPTSYTFGVKGLQNITINRNLFDNDLDFELLGGYSSSSLENYLDVTENYWGTIDQAIIQAKIFDFDDWNSYAIAEYYPFLVSDNFEALVTTVGKLIPEFNPNRPLGGRIEENLVLPYRSTPYIVRSDLTVMPDVSLRLEKGVELQFYPNVGILVLGSLTAIGSPESKIKFNPIPKEDIDSRLKKRALTDDSDEEIQVRLIGGETEDDGWIEVYNATERRWVLICDDSFNDRTAEVACKAMGREWSNVMVRTHRYYDIFVLGYPKMHEQVIEWYWRRTFICDGTEAELRQCRYKQNYNLYRCMERREYVYVRCGPRNLAPEFDYWGNIRFSTPQYQHGEITPGFSALDYVDIYGAGILHEERVAAVQAVHRVPSTTHVRISHCNWNGYDYIAPRDEFEVTYNQIENNNGYAIGGLVLNGDSRYDIPQSSFEPLEKSGIPYNVYGLVRMCTTEKLIYVKDRLLLYYKYRFDTIDCIKVIRSRDPHRQVALRFLQINMYNDSFYRNSVELYEGEYFDNKLLLGELTSDSSLHDKSIKYETGPYFDTMGIRVTASPAFGEYGFIAEVVTLPVSPGWRPDLGAGIRQRIANSHLVNNEGGGFMFMNVGELNPSLIIEQNHITDCGLPLLNMTGPPIFDLFVQNSKLMTIANNYISHNAGGITINTTTKGQATRIYANITNNQIIYNTHGEALHIEGHRFQEFDIRHNYIAFNHLEHRNVLGMFGVGLNFTENIVYNNTARCILNASVPQQVTINQRYIHNAFYDNWAFAENRSTIFLKSAKFNFHDNYLINRFNRYEMVLFNRTKYPDGTFPQVDARSNWWGGDVESFVAGRIWDRRDDDNLIEVSHTPYYKTNASVLSGINLVWVDNSSANYYYVSQYHLGTNKLLQTRYVGKCDPGWVEYSSKCYWYFGGVVNYATADKQCRVIMGRLAYARDRNWEKGFGEVVTKFQENHDETWTTWVFSSEQKGSHCTALQNGRIIHTDCEVLWPYLCEKDPFVQPKLFMREIWIAIGAVAGGLLIILVLLCFHCLKSHKRKEERLGRKGSMKRALMSSKASLYSGRTGGASQRGGYDDVQQQKRRRPPMSNTAISEFMDLSGATLDSTSTDAADKMKYTLDSHRPITPGTGIDMGSRNDSCSYLDSDLGPVHHRSRDFFPPRLENEITNYSARQPSYDHVFRNDAYEGGIERRIPSSSSIGYPPQHRYSGGADVGGASSVGSYAPSINYQPSGYQPSTRGYHSSSASGYPPSTSGYHPSTSEYQPSSRRYQPTTPSEASYYSDTVDMEPDSRPKTRQGGGPGQGGYVKPPRPKPKEFSM